MESYISLGWKGPLKVMSSSPPAVNMDKFIFLLLNCQVIQELEISDYVLLYSSEMALVLASPFTGASIILLHVSEDHRVKKNCFFTYLYIWEYKTLLKFTTPISLYFWQCVSCE